MNDRRRFRKFGPRFWRDEKVRTLDTAEKLVATYAFTGQSNRIGCFAFSPGMAAEDTGLPYETVRERLRNVCRTLNWRWDERVGVLYLPTWWKYNQPENPNNLIGNLKDLDDVPDSPLVAEFCQNLDHLDPELHETFGQTLAKRYPKRSGIQEQEQKQQKEQEQEICAAPPHAAGQPADRPVDDAAYGVAPNGGRSDARTAEEPPQTAFAINQNGDSTRARANAKHYAARAREILAYLNETSGHSYEPVASNLRGIVARLKDRAQLGDADPAGTCRRVIDAKAREWRGTEMAKFLSPGTLFRPEKFNTYVGQLGSKGSSDAPLLTPKGAKNVEAARLAIERNRQLVQEGQR